MTTLDKGRKSVNGLWGGERLRDHAGLGEVQKRRASADSVGLLPSPKMNNLHDMREIKGKGKVKREVGGGKKVNARARRGMR
jgi:hypothetical protein